MNMPIRPKTHVIHRGRGSESQFGLKKEVSFLLVKLNFAG